MTAALRPVRAELDVLLASRLRRSLAGSVLARRTATVVFESGDSSWTVELDDGRTGVHRGAAPRPTLVIRASPDVLAEVVSGRRSGVHAFLDGEVTVRGDLGLSLQLDGLFGVHSVDSKAESTLPRAREVVAMGVRTSFLQAGPADAPPVVLLHGLGATNASLLPCLADLARDHRVLAPDLPGFGTSDAPRVAYSFPWFAAWLQEFQRTVEARRAVLLGNSLGGRIALEAGLTHPSAVEGLVLLTPSPAFRRLRALAPLARLVRPELGLVPMPLLPMGLNHRMTVAGIRMLLSRPERLPQPWYDAAADECQRVLSSAAHREALLACGRHIVVDEPFGRHGFWDRLPGLVPPALFVWGDRDRLVPPAFARHVGAALPGATSVVLEDCGHVPQFEHPAATMSLVREFLRSLSESPPRAGSARAGQRPVAR